MLISATIGFICAAINCYCIKGNNNNSNSNNNNNNNNCFYYYYYYYYVTVVVTKVLLPSRYSLQFLITTSFGIKCFWSK